MIRFKVPGDMDGLSAEGFLREKVRQVQPEWFTAGKVRLLPFGRKLTPGTPLKGGSTVLLMIEGQSADHAKPPEIVYEDEEFLVYNKPQGISCIDKGEKGENLYAHAVAHMEANGEYDVHSLKVPYLCNLPDKDSGGLVIVAKEQYLFEMMLEALRQRRIKRVYQVVVTGQPKEKALLYGYMERGTAFSKTDMPARMNRNARPVALRYRLLAQVGELSLLEVEPQSFLKQQIPLQLQKAGLPILGEERYGDPAMNQKYAAYAPAIWAYKMVFETGRGNDLEYLNGREVQCSLDRMPGIGYFRERRKEAPRVELLNEKQVKQAVKLAQSVFGEALAEGCSKQASRAFREFAKPGRLTRAAEAGEVLLYGCYGADGLCGMAAAAQGQLQLLFVRAQDRGRGVGSALLKQAEAAQRDGMTVYAPANAAPFFEKHGYRAQEWAVEPEQDLGAIPMYKEI